MAHSKKFKFRKPVQEEVNPIAFGCNNSMMARLDYNVSRGAISDSPEIVSAMKEMVSDREKALSTRRLKTLPLTVHAYETVTGKRVNLEGPLGLPVNQYLCDAFVYPGKNCRFRKLSVRATNFLLSLGKPSDELRIQYREFLHDSALKGEEVEVLPGGVTATFHEELLELPINGRTEYIHLLSSPEMCYVIHRRDCRAGDNEYFNIPVHPSVRDHEMLGAKPEYDAAYDNAATGNVFDVEALLANLWIAEELRTCTPCPEPEWSARQTDMPAVQAGKKPLKHSVAYRYIHITDDVLKKYEPALKSVSEQSNFTVPSWFVRAHYARMRGKTVLVRAHYAFRRKGTVSGETATDYIV